MKFYSNTEGVLHRFHFLRFTIKTLFGLVLVIGVVFAVVADRFRSKEMALKRLSDLGAEISFDYQWEGQFGNAGKWKPDAKLPGSSILRGILGEHYAANVVEVRLFKSDNRTFPMFPANFSDSDAELLRKLDSIDWLVLQDTMLTDDGLMYLADIESLGRLDIEGTRVTQKGIEAFRTARPDVVVYSDFFE